MIHNFIDIKGLIVLGINLLAIPIMPVLAAIGILSTIIYNGIRIYKELKNKK